MRTFAGMLSEEATRGGNQQGGAWSDEATKPIWGLKFFCDCTKADRRRLCSATWEEAPTEPLPVPLTIQGKLPMAEQGHFRMPPPAGQPAPRVALESPGRDHRALLSPALPSARNAPSSHRDPVCPPPPPQSRAPQAPGQELTRPLVAVPPPPASRRGFSADTPGIGHGVIRGPSCSVPCPARTIHSWRTLRIQPAKPPQRYSCCFDTGSPNR